MGEYDKLLHAQHQALPNTHALPSPHQRPRPGHPGNLSPTQTSALLQLTGQLSTDGTLPPSSQFTGDDLEVPLCRFLRARNWNVSQARDMWNKSVEWKESIDLETLLRTFDFEEREKVAKAIIPAFETLPRKAACEAR